MKCSFELDIQQYIDKEYTSEEMKLMELHIESCSYCQEIIEQQLELSENIRSKIQEHLQKPESIPVFVPPTKAKLTVRKKKASVIQLFTMLAAASIILAFIINNLYSAKTDEFDLLMLNTLDQQLDANLPFSEQEFEIQVFDGNGKRMHQTID